MKLSVIVCCFNSEERLLETLTSLSKQKTKYLWELLIIDNNSSDNTSSFAKQCWKNLETSTQIKIITEPKPGLSNARKTGVLNSTGEFIIFCDDDNHLYEDFIDTAITIMEKHPKIGALCGKNIPLHDTKLNDIVKNNLVAYACGHEKKKEGLLDKTTCPWGAGLTLRSSIIKSIYSSGFESLLNDRKGTELSSGGDTEICYIIHCLGYDWYYSPKLKLKHKLPEERLNFEYLKKLFFGFGKASVIIDWYYKRGEIVNQKQPIPWWKAYVSQHLILIRKKHSNSKQQAILEKEFEKGVLHQLYKERNNFKNNQKKVQLFIKSVKKK